MNDLPTAKRTCLAGVAGGVAFVVAMVLTFRLIGFGLNADGFLLDPRTQSPKLIAVWTQIEPLPLVITRPELISIGIIALGVLHGFLYRWLSAGWPKGTTARGLRMALLIFCFTFLFWEFFTPYNQLGEPVVLIAAELVFWAVIAISEGLTIAAVMEGVRTGVKKGNPRV
jgi:hypothetical protein